MQTFRMSSEILHFPGVTQFCQTDDWSFFEELHKNVILVVLDDYYTMLTRIVEHFSLKCSTDQPKMCFWCNRWIEIIVLLLCRCVYVKHFSLQVIANQKRPSCSLRISRLAHSVNISGNRLNSTLLYYCWMLPELQ